MFLQKTTLVTTVTHLLVMMGLLIFSPTSNACGIMKSVVQHQEKNHEKTSSRRSLLADAAAATANLPNSLVQLGRTVAFNGTLQFESLGAFVRFSSVLSNDGTVLAIGFDPYQAYQALEENRVYVYRLSNPNTNKAKWVQTAYFARAIPSNRLLQGNVALSGDGKVLAIGAGNASSGSVMVYRFQSNKWVPLGSVSPVAGLEHPEVFGVFLALSFNGSILAVQTFADDRLDSFRWNGTAWRQRGSIYLPSFRYFSMSQDGNVVAISTIFNVIRTFRFVASSANGGAWVQFGETLIFADDYGSPAMSLSGNGKRLAVLVFSDILYKSMLRVYEFNSNYNDWISVGSGVTQTLASDGYYVYGASVSLSIGGSLVAEWRGAASEYCPGEVRVFQVTKNGTWPQIYKYDGPYIRSLIGLSAALSGDGKTLAVANFGFETYRVVSN